MHLTGAFFPFRNPPHGLPVRTDACIATHADQDIVLFGQMAGDIVRFPEERRMFPNPLHDIGAFTE